MSLPEPLFNHETIMVPVEPEPATGEPAPAIDRPASIRVPRFESADHDDDETPDLTTSSCEEGD